MEVQYLAGVPVMIFQSCLTFHEAPCCVIDFLRTPRRRCSFHLFIIMCMLYDLFEGKSCPWRLKVIGRFLSTGLMIETRENE